MDNPNLGNRFNQHSFAKAPSVNSARSMFDRSFTIKDTYDFDYLNPLFFEEVLPGDDMNVTVQHFARLATQLVPIMDNMYIDFFFFFVPNRLVYDNWEKLNGQQNNPGDSTDFICPQLTFPAGGPEVGSIFDKYGLPTDIAAGYTIKNSMPLRGYNLVVNEWFRDQNLQDSIVVPKDDGPDAPSDFALVKRNKLRDYFTSALPWPQKGPSVELPLGSTAPVISTGLNPKFLPIGDVSPGSDRNFIAQNPGVFTALSGANMAGQQLKFGAETGLVADLSDAAAATVNQLREAFMVQSVYELDARGGTRYVEILMSHFNVDPGDYRLQRPEYLGGGTARINSHPVAATVGESGAPQGTLAAFGTSSSAGSNIGFTKSFVEHGYVIGFLCARADITYQQGLDKMWQRSTRFDFFWPKFQELGEQAILNSEIYLTGTSADDQVFGYQERFGDYRFRRSEIRGQFRSTYAESLDYWHMAEEFGTAPALNATFIQQATPIERAIATPNEPDLLFDGWIQLKHTRKMVGTPTPATLGRF